MKINYFIVTDEVHGRPITEMSSSNIEELKTKYHPVKLMNENLYSFIDIELEDQSNLIEQNVEALRLHEILDISQDTMEEIITDQRPRADDYQDFFLILFKNLSLEVKDSLDTSQRDNAPNQGQIPHSIRINYFKINKHKLKTIDIKKKNEYYDFMIKERMFKLIEHQIGIIIKENLVISIHKASTGLEVSELFKRFQKYPLKISRGGVTYLVTSYIDMLIDSIYQVLDVWTRSINIYEREIVQNPKKSMVFDILTLRHRLLDLIKILQADREIITNIRSGKIKYFKISEIPPELDDHIKHLLDETDIIRSLLDQILEIYYSAHSVELNDSMRRFTVITSSLLLPSLIAGIFGMNNYPDLKINFYETIAVMIISMILLILILKYKEFI
ncbi:MAG: magnesium transporter CorA family protein [Promethearchaeota archaeon]